MVHIPVPDVPANWDPPSAALIFTKEPTMAESPSVGRIVHYVSYGTPGGEYDSVCRAAVITEVNGPKAVTPGLVGLCVLNPTGNFFNQGVAQDEAVHRGGTWHWPERT